MAGIAAITFETTDNGGIRVQKVTQKRYAGKSQEALESYQESLIQDKAGNYYFGENVESLSQHIHGSYVSFVEQQSPPLYHMIFDISTWYDDPPNMTRLPFSGESGQLFTKTVGYIPWEDNCKLWSVTDDSGSTFASNQSCKMLLLTYGASDEKMVGKFNADSGTPVFEKLDVQQNRWLSRNAEGGWVYSNYNGYNRPWVKLCVLRPVHMADINNWEAIERM